MLVYVVGMSELTNGNPSSDPYYFAYSTNQQVANQYYNALLERFEGEHAKHNPSSYDNFYFIQKLSKSKFDLLHEDKSSLLYNIPELEEYGDGVYMTESDYEYYCETLMDTFDQINHAMTDMGEFVTAIKRCAKFTKNKRIREDVKLFRAALKALKADFADYDAYLEDVNLSKIQRSNSI